MAIRSLDELRAIREKNKGKVGLRHGEGFQGDEVRVLVGMGTCGIAAGARETMNAITGRLADRGIDKVHVVPVGCVGDCSLEPLVAVMAPGAPAVAYGKVDAEKARLIVEDHIIGGRPVQTLVVDVDFGEGR